MSTVLTIAAENRAEADARLLLMKNGPHSNSTARVLRRGFFTEAGLFTIPSADITGDDGRAFSPSGSDIYLIVVEFN